MKIQKAKTKKKMVIIPIFFIIIITAAYTWYSHHYQLWPFLPKTTKTIELNNNNSNNNPTKASTIKKVDGVDTSKNSSNIPVSTETKISITNLSQNENIISYSAHIANPAKTGVCRATFTKENSKTLVYTTDTSSEDCTNSAISANDFDSIGTWILTLNYFSNNTQAIATSTIEVK